MIIEVIKSEINNALEKMEIINNKNIIIDKSKNIKIGDFSSNVALIYAKENNKSPTEFANELIEFFDKKLFKNITITNPGFINFFVAEELFSKSLLEVLDKKDKYLLFDKKDKKYSVEYVSANPTGYLHIGHSRNGVLGDVIKNLLITYGYDVVTEYVVNDAGNQMNNLATAVFIRYLQLFGNKIELPKDSYHGQEIKIVAQKLKDEFNDKFIKYELLENQITDIKIKDEIK
jgi:arginyl-tRNA synthetase